MYDLVVKGDRIAADYGVFSGAIAVKDGKVAALFGPDQSPTATTIIDATGKIVFPGCIDSHVHIWEPGKTHRDDFDSGTQAAARGGVTTILEHPLSIPPVKDAETYKLKLGIASQKARVDFGLWGALVPDNVDKIAVMRELGGVAFKGFMSYANPDYPHVNDYALYNAMKTLAPTGLIIAVHAENADMAEEGGKEMQRRGRIDPLAHLEGREAIVEIEAINRAIFFAEQTGARLHIVHMTCHEGAQAIKEAKARGVKVTVETCPQYLAADCGLLEKRGPFAKCTPPLRRPDNTEKMWDYVRDGSLDFIASDHSCYTKEEKSRGIDNIYLAEPGLPGIGTMVPMMADAFINKRKLPLERFAQMMATNVAKIFGIFPQKGSIIPGGDADFTIIDPDKKWIVDGAKLYKCGWSPYDGDEIGAAVEATIVRGVTVYRDGQVLVERGFGQYVQPIR